MRKYAKHMYTNMGEFMTEFQSESITKDRKYMGKVIKPIILFLNCYGVNKYQDFYQLLKNYELKSKDISSMIIDFINYINSNGKLAKINWFKIRELKKSNSGEKNIIMNRLALEYPNEFIGFVYSYMSTIRPRDSNINILMDQFRSSIDVLEKKKDFHFFLQHFTNNNPEKMF